MDGNSQVRARIADITGSGLLLWQKELPTKRCEFDATGDGRQRSR